MIDDHPKSATVESLPPARSAGSVQTDHGRPGEDSGRSIPSPASLPIRPWKPAVTLGPLPPVRQPPVAVIKSVPPFGLDCKSCEVINCFPECPIYGDRTP
jgi:hypothetical protein